MISCRFLVIAAGSIALTFNPGQLAGQKAATPARSDHREVAADQQVIHALNRLTFGPRPGDAQKIRAIGIDKWIDQQLDPAKIDNSALDAFIGRYSILNRNQNDLLAEYAEAQRDRRSARRDASGAEGASREDTVAFRQVALSRRQVIGQIQSARVARAVASNRQLEEVMTDFWLNHFSVFAQKGPPQAFFLAEYERNAIRPNALGKFRDLLGAVAKSPAMLFYLDNARSMADSTRPRLGSTGRNRGLGEPDAVLRVMGRRGRMRSARRAAGNAGMQQQAQQRINQLRNGGLNENYGRELLELHTLGVDGGYTQQDVINVARALTGWTIDRPAAGGGFVFRPQMHDAGEKVVLGHKLGGGRGIEDGEQVLDIVARHPATARYIATKLARRFVADDPPKALVDQAAAVFTRTDGDIRAVVRSIITSNEFFSAGAYRAKIKSPFEVVVSAMRAMNAEPDSTPRTAQVIAYLGQPIFGHQAPNGYPESGEAWMNTGAILNRINFGTAAASNRIPGARINAIPGLDTLRSAPRAKQVDAIAALLLGGSISPDTRAVLLSGENPLLATAAAAHLADPTGTDSLNEPQMMQPPPPRASNNNNALGRPGTPLPQLTGIAQVVGLALGSPEFQRR